MTDERSDVLSYEEARHVLRRFGYNDDLEAQANELLDAIGFRSWEELIKQLPKCEACGHVQGEPNWCEQCGHRTEWPAWATAWEEKRRRLQADLTFARAAASVEQAIKWRDERDAARALADQLASHLIAAHDNMPNPVYGWKEVLDAWEVRGWK